MICRLSTNLKIPPSHSNPLLIDRRLESWERVIPAINRFRIVDILKSRAMLTCPKRYRWPLAKQPRLTLICPYLHRGIQPSWLDINLNQANHNLHIVFEVRTIGLHRIDTAQCSSRDKVELTPFLKSLVFEPADEQVLERESWKDLG